MSEFISEVGNTIARASIGTGYFPSVIIAQAILESNWGNSTLTKSYNNFFGIKAGSTWQGQTVDMQTGEVFDGKEVLIYDAFRVYETKEKSIKDRISWMQETQRYAGVEILDTPELQVKEIQRSGYATDPNYADKIIQLINDYDLIQYDKNKQIMKAINITIAVLLLVVALLGIYKNLKY